MKKEKTKHHRCFDFCCGFLFPVLLLLSTDQLHGLHSLDVSSALPPVKINLSPLFFVLFVLSVLFFFLTCAVHLKNWKMEWALEMLLNLNDWEKLQC